MQHNQIWKFFLNKFETGHNATEAPQNIYCTGTRQGQSGWPKLVDSEAVLQAIEWCYS